MLESRREIHTLTASLRFCGSVVKAWLQPACMLVGMHSWVA